MKTKLHKIVSAMDALLRVGDFKDDSHNGLQVENHGSVSKIALGVDASMDFFQRAKDSGADMCVVHHGISWGTSLAKINGENYRLVRFLIENGIALYAAHLPLDAHPQVGNNARIARALGLENLKPFCEYHGQKIGWKGELRRALPFEEFCNLARDRIHGRGAAEEVAAGARGVAAHPRTFVALPFGKPKVRTVGVASGGAASDVSDAIADGLDCYLTGEMNLQAWNAAKAGAINMLAAGHYATERFGVKAAGEFLNEHFKITCEFFDFDIPF